MTGADNPDSIYKPSPVFEKWRKEIDDFKYYSKKKCYPPKDGEPCLDGKPCCKEIAEWGFKCRHGDCTWFCPLKLQKEKEHKEFQELFDWMEKRK